MQRVTIQALELQTCEDAAALIRKILKTEFPTLISGSDDGNDLEEFYSYHYAARNSAWIARKDGGEIIGVVAIEQESDGAARLTRLYLLKNCRGHGPGNELYRTAESFCRDQDFRFMRLTMSSDMKAAQKNFQRQGFDLSETQAENSGFLEYEKILTRAKIGEKLPAPDGLELDSPPDNVKVVIERPRGSVDGWHHDGVYIVMRKQYITPVPVNYGYVPGTLNPADSQELDAIVADDRLFQAAEVLSCSIVGVLRRKDGDDKLIVTPSDLVPIPSLKEVIDGFESRIHGWWGADDLPTGWQGAAEARKLLRKCIAARNALGGKL